MNTRLKQFLAAENITQAQFADKIDVVRASVSHVLSGRNNPSFDFIKAMMVHYPDLNMEWLIFGKGKMYKDKSAGESPSQPSTPADTLLFPEIDLEEPPTSVNSVQEIRSERNFEPTTALKALDNISQTPEKQRKVSKILVLFDDGTYQEM